VRYLGFKCTEEGREYSLRVDANGVTRVFVLVITHASFAAREARFQDAPDMCFAKLQKALLADASLLPGPPLVLTSADLADYQAQAKRSSERKTRKAPAPEAAGN
jgi:hypothetical protein